MDGDRFDSNPAVITIQSNEAALAQMAASANEANIVVFVEDDYGIGFDLKFQHDAKVIVMIYGKPDAEQTMQMLGRGARNMNSDLGIVLILDDEGRAAGLKNTLLTNEGPDFKEGAKLLHLANQWHQLKDKKAFQWLKNNIKRKGLHLSLLFN